MKYIYAGKGMDVTESLKARAEKKLEKLERYFKEEPEANIRFRQQKGARNTVEITISTGGVILRSEECSNDMYLSIDRAVDKLESQIRRYRTKLDKRLRASELEPVVEVAPTFEEARYDIVRVKKFQVKPMDVEDAITQMELLGHNFFLFMNEENEAMNVLYRRNDGSYGLLQPDL
ncbi:MAG: ribosome-associated translation inhibitor RaiA [Christensenellales bacterium]|nr:ribosome-associated translation inhibitor RaiA [Christensenellales bacterium]